MIAITPADIATGEHYHCVECPAGLAANRWAKANLPGWRVAIFPDRVRFRRGDDVHHDEYDPPTPPDLARWIADFDFDHPVQPATFTIDLPPDLERRCTAAPD